MIKYTFSTNAGFEGFSVKIAMFLSTNFQLSGLAFFYKVSVLSRTAFSILLFCKQVFAECILLIIFNEQDNTNQLRELNKILAKFLNKVRHTAWCMVTSIFVLRSKFHIRVYIIF